MSRIVIVNGKKMRVPEVVATQGPFILVRRITQVPKPLGIEFVVKRKTDFGNILVSSTFGGAKTKAQGMLRLKLAAKAERAAIVIGIAAKNAGIDIGRKAGKALFKRFAKSIGGTVPQQRKSPKRRKKAKKRRK